MYEELKKLIYDSSPTVFYNGYLLNEIDKKYNMELLTKEEYDDLLAEYEETFEGWQEEPVFCEYLY